MEMKHYNVSIDIAKMFCIFLVVLYHVPPSIVPEIAIPLKHLRMPLFFMIAGYLFKIEKYNSVLKLAKRRAKQLLLPYFSFSFFFYILWLFLGKKYGNAADLEASFYTPIVQFLLGDPKLVCAPLWFLVCLFEIQIIYYFIVKYIKHPVVIALLMVGFWLVSEIEIIDTLPYKLYQVCYYLPFYAMGNLYRKYIDKYIFNKKSVWLIPVCCCIYILLIMPYHFVLIEAAKSIAILVGFLCFCKLIEPCFPSKISRYIAYNSIIILCLQNYVIAVIRILLNAVFNINLLTLDSNILINLSVAFITVLLIIPAIAFINKYCPYIIGRTHNDGLYKS